MRSKARATRVGARAVLQQPYDGRTLTGQLEQRSIRFQDLSATPQPKTALADLGFRGVDFKVSSVKLINREKYKLSGDIARFRPRE